MKKFWNLVILVLAAALFYQLYAGGKFNNIRKSVVEMMMPTNRSLIPGDTAIPKAAGTPVFAAESESSESSESSEAAEPAPAATPFFASTPEPSAQPVIAVSSTPAEEAARPAASAAASGPGNGEAVDLAALDRRYWPRMVKLNKAVDFAIVINGKEAGKAAAPAGVMVKLLEINGDKLSVSMATGSAPATVAAADTDVEERVREIMKVVGSVSAPATAAPSTGFGAKPGASPFEPKLNDRGRTPFQRH